jgi:hypothetical protein
MKISTLALLSSSYVAAAVAYNVPLGSPGFYHGNSTAAVTFDGHSLFLDGKRLYVFSGEIHPWRAPTGVTAWRDILQKMKVGSAATAPCSDSIIHPPGCRFQHRVCVSELGTDGRKTGVS